jgi:4-hydroxyphenylacetate 3-monooxygenase
LRVVEKRSDGIVVRGAKAVATLAPYADEYLCLTPAGRGMTPAEVVYFATPMAAPGIRVVCRPSFSHQPSEDHQLSARYDEMDAWVILKDVFVSRERVFYLENAERIPQLFGRILAWAGYHILCRMAVKAEVLAGICFAITDYLGTAKLPQVEPALADAIVYLETLRGYIHSAERRAAPTPSGLLAPDPVQVILGRIYGVERHPRILQTMRELCGSGLLMAPGEEDVASPDTGPDVARYLVGGDPRAFDRFRLLKLAWEYAGDAFGSRQLLFEMYNANTLATNRARLLSAYDPTALAALARSLAGIADEA